MQRAVDIEMRKIRERLEPIIKEKQGMNRKVKILKYLIEKEIKQGEENLMKEHPEISNEIVNQYCLEFQNRMKAFQFGIMETFEINARLAEKKSLTNFIFQELDDEAIKLKQRNLGSDTTKVVELMKESYGKIFDDTIKSMRDEFIACGKRRIRKQLDHAYERQILKRNQYTGITPSSWKQFTIYKQLRDVESRARNGEFVQSDSASRFMDIQAVTWKKKFEIDLYNCMKKECPRIVNRYIIAANLENGDKWMSAFDILTERLESEINIRNNVMKFKYKNEFYVASHYYLKECILKRLYQLHEAQIQNQIDEIHKERKTRWKLFEQNTKRNLSREVDFKKHSIGVHYDDHNINDRLNEIEGSDISMWQRIANLKRLKGIESNPEFVVVIGETGLGKSSLIKLLTNNDAVKCQSCTIKTEIWAHDMVHSNILYIDTVGMSNYSKMKKTDDELLYEIFECIHESKGCDVKFIWFVKGSNTATNTLKKQAQFIQRIGKRVVRQNSSDENKEEKESCIWDSVFMVLSRPRRGDLDEDVNAFGAMQASYAFGCPEGDESAPYWNCKTNLFGYTTLDWIPWTAKGYRRIKSAYERGRPEVDHIDKKNEIKIIVSERIFNDNIIKKHAMKFDTNIGDPEFMKHKYCHRRPSKGKENIKCHKNENYQIGHLSDFGGEEYIYKHDHMVRIHPPDQVDAKRSGLLGSVLGIVSQRKCHSCNRGIASAGCTRVCRKCKKRPDTRGCIKVCPECNGTSGAAGCSFRFKCCGTTGSFKDLENGQSNVLDYKCCGVRCAFCDQFHGDKLVGECGSKNNTQDHEWQNVE